MRRDCMPVALPEDIKGMAQTGGTLILPEVFQGVELKDEIEQL